MLIDQLDSFFNVYLQPAVSSVSRFFFTFLFPGIDRELQLWAVPSSFQRESWEVSGRGEKTERIPFLHKRRISRGILYYKVETDKKSSFEGIPKLVFRSKQKII